MNIILLIGRGALDLIINSVPISLAIIGLLVSVLVIFFPTLIALAEKNSNWRRILLLNGIAYIISTVTIFIQISVVNELVAMATVILWVISFIKTIKG